MELPDIAKRVFGKDYYQGSTSRIVCKTNKKIFLLEVREWLDEYLNDISSQSVSSSINYNSTAPATAFDAEDDDNRPGRIGSNNVYFTLDRSFGIVAINQEGLNVVGACRFATVAACCGVFQGKWMYELHLGSKGIMQIGWCSNFCNFTIDRGCGDTPNSYAFDGSRVKSWNMLSREYGEFWKTGDVIGLCIDLDNGTIEFYRNGRPLGVAFSELTTGSGVIYLPSVSLVEGESVYANFGSRPFKYPVRDFEPLQQKPNTKIRQADYLFKWLKNLTNLVTPNEPNILDCNLTGDISDQLFWNRFYSALCYHLNIILSNRYCLFNNFLPFVVDICGFKADKDEANLDRFKRVMDEMWMYIKERHMEKTLFQIFIYLSNSFKQVSETLNCSSKNNILKVCWAFISHDTTRKYIIKNFLFERLDIFAFMHHKPLDESYFNDIIGNTWWDTKGIISEIEKYKKSFRSSFIKIEKSYDELERRQCKLLKVLLKNDDGSDVESSSRVIFLKKLRKFCWHELECSRNELNSKIPSSIAYAAFLRMVKVLNELWKEETNEDEIIFSARCFYDHTFKYSNCDRVGGLEQFLIHTLHDELMVELGENHTIFSADSNRHTPSIPIPELRAIGLAETVNLLESSESVIENFILPTTSNGPFYQALFAPFLRDGQNDNEILSVDNKTSLLELNEDLLMFFISTVAKHCRKISRVQSNLEQNAADFNCTYLNFSKLKKTLPKNDPLLLYLQNTMDLQKEDLSKRAKKNAWIEYVLLSYPRLNIFIKMYKSLLRTVSEAEKQGDLFVFLPDFYFDACDIYTEVLVKDFIAFKTLRPGDEIESLVRKMAELMIHLLGDQRIKHIDCKKIPINTLASMTTSPAAMKILESVSPEKRIEFVEKLIVPYGDRHWKASNWILIRFWHGSGYGFRYTSLPHHNFSVQDVINPANYVMYNIACSPSKIYQNIVREKLLVVNANIPALLDSIISELHWTFGEFLTPMQELQRAIEKNEQLLMMGRLYKMCSTYFDKTIGLLRVLDMFIYLAPKIFLESYYPESTAFTRRIIQVVLLIIHRISSKHGCFRIVMNSRIAVLENVEYFPIESACIAILLGILRHELDNFNDDDITIPLFCRMVLTDPSYDYDNLRSLIGSPENRNSAVVSLHDYEKDVILESELADARKLLHMLNTFMPLLSNMKVIPEDELCTICYSAPFDVKFSPCGHYSCLSCISYYITKNRLCFFCKQNIVKVIRLENNEVIDSLTEKEVNIQI